MAWKSWLNPIGSVMGGIGQFVGALGGISAEKKNYELQKDQIGWQKDQWQTQMNREDTAMQRKMADLQAAGLNPILAAGGSGSQSSPAPQLQAPQRDAGQIQRSLAALAPVQVMQDIARTKAETKRIQAETDKTNIETKHEVDKIGKTISETRLNEMNLKQSELRYSIDERDFRILKQEIIGMRSDIKSGYFLDMINAGEGGVTLGIQAIDKITAALFGDKKGVVKTVSDAVQEKTSEALADFIVYYQNSFPDKVDIPKDAPLKDVAAAYLDIIDSEGLDIKGYNKAQTENWSKEDSPLYKIGVKFKDWVLKTFGRK